MTQPLVEFAEYLRRLRKLKVRFPAGHVGPELFGDLRQPTPTRATRHLSDTLFEGLFRLVRNLALDLTASAIPEGIAEELSARYGRNCRLRFVDLQMESVVEPTQPIEHPFARAKTAHIHIAVVGIAHEVMATSFQFPIHLVEQHVGQQRRQYAAYDLAYFASPLVNPSSPRRH
jgi:hypothetical protein